MLELVVVTIVIVARKPFVMIAVVFMHERRKGAGVMIGQRFKRLSDPGLMRDTAAEQHRGSGEGLQRQR